MSTIAQWWNQHPEANVAIATGEASGVLVLRHDASVIRPPLQAVIDTVLAAGAPTVFCPGATSAESLVGVESSPGRIGEIASGLHILADDELAILPPSRTLEGALSWGSTRPTHELPLCPWPVEDLVDLVVELTGSQPEADAGTASAPDCDSTLELVRVADMEPEPVPWLWPGYIPLRAITLLDGDPGLGKSSLLQEIAARVTRGKPAPRSTHAMPRGGVLLLAGEDDGPSVIRPRLDAAGADLLKVFVLNGVRGERGLRPTRLPLDADLIEAACHEHGIRLLVVDPIMEFLNGSVDALSDHGVRRALSPLVDIARAADLAVVVVRHLVKNRRGAAMHHGSGSIGFSALARSVLRVDEGEHGLVLRSVKSSLGPRPSPVGYRIESVKTPLGSVGRVMWSEEPMGDLCPPISKLEQAKEFLLRALDAGSVPKRDLVAQADQLDIGERTLEKAKSALNIKSRKAGRAWEWLLPQQQRNPPDPQGHGEVAFMGVS